MHLSNIFVVYLISLFVSQILLELQSGHAHGFDSFMKVRTVLTMASGTLDKILFVTSVLLEQIKEFTLTF